MNEMLLIMKADSNRKARMEKMQLIVRNAAPTY